MSRVLLTVLFAFSALAQNVDRTFTFTHTDQPQSMREVATLIRAVGEIRDLNVDTSRKSIAMSGTQTQAKLSEWLFQELDQPAPPSPDPAVHEYKIDNDREGIVRVFHLPHVR